MPASVSDAVLRLLRDHPGDRRLFLASLEQARAAREGNWRDVKAGFSLVASSRPS